MKLNEYVDLSKEAEEKYESLFRLFEASPVNVTAIKSREDFFIKHILDSIYYFSKHEFAISTVADIGSGGGFPGLALAIYRPDWRLTLVESIGKKCRFIEESALELSLDNVFVAHSRAEALKGVSYDLITSRGVGTVSEVLGYTHHLAHSGTNWLMYKGEKVEAELELAAPLLKKRGLKSEITRVETPFTRSYLRLYSGGDH